MSILTDVSTFDLGVLYNFPTCVYYVILTLIYFTVAKVNPVLIHSNALNVLVHMPLPFLYVTVQLFDTVINISCSR